MRPARATCRPRGRARFRTGTLAVALLGALMLLPATAGARQSDDDPGDTRVVVVEAPRQVTGNDNAVRLFDIPSLTVDPDDPLTVVMAVGDARAGGCGLYVSRDGGASWGNTAPNFLPEEYDFCLQRPLFPVMDPVFASDGTLHVAFPGSATDEGHPDGPITMLAARTDNLGGIVDVSTVVEGGLITADPADYGQEGEPAEGFTWHKAPSLVVDPNDPDTLYLGMRWNVWGTDSQSFPGDVPFRPWVAVSTDGGQSWDEPIDMVENSDDNSIYGALHTDMVADPEGTLYAFTREFTAPDSEADSRPLMFRSTDGAQTWEIRPFLEDVQEVRAPYASVDPDSGDLYVVYNGAVEERSEDPDAPAPAKELFVTASRDGGNTWAEPTQINDPASSGHDSTAPNISVAPNGRIDVAWHDFRNDPFGPDQIESFFRGERYWDVYHTYSTDGGRRWSSDTRVTPTFIDAAEGATYNNMEVRGPTGLASTDEFAYIAWPDSRATGEVGSAEDAYFTRLRFADIGDAGAAQLPGADRGGDIGWLSAVIGAGAALALGGVILLLSVRRSRPRSEPVAS